MYIDPKIFTELSQRIKDHDDVITSEQAKRDELASLLSYLKFEKAESIKKLSKKAADASTSTTNK